jgi:hypothetical protein
VRGGHEQVLDPVVVLRRHGHHADAAATLRAIRVERDALDVAVFVTEISMSSSGMVDS